INTFFLDVTKDIVGAVVNENTVPSDIVRVWCVVAKMFLTRIYDLKKTYLNQKLFLKRYNRLLGYNCNFNENFKLSFCNNCHSRYECSKKCLKATDSSPTDADYITIEEDSDSLPDSTDDDLDFSGDYMLPNNKSSKNSVLKAKFIFDSDKFDIFLYNFVKHIRKYLNHDKIDKDDIEISYKINGCGQAMALDDECDYNAFITECKNLTRSKKNMKLIEEGIDLNEEKLEPKSKKLKTSCVLKESNLTPNEVNLATIISELRSKYCCNIHPTPCYIEDNKHLQLMPAHLHLWAQDVVSTST
ncbi:14515_t:CDS:2, partial [Racocetra fulgida]